MLITVYIAINKFRLLNLSSGLSLDSLSHGNNFRDDDEGFHKFNTLLQWFVDGDSDETDDYNDDEGPNDHDDDEGLLHCSDTMLQLSLRVPPVCLPRAINPTPW